jgi:DDE superfamily endonuclease
MLVVGRALELYSGKHKTTGMNVQVACTLGGGLAWISDAIDGSRHDTYCLSDLLTLDPGNWTGDKGYVGNDMITPIRNPPIASFWTGRRNSTGRLTKFATSSSRRSPTSRPGGSCTPIIAGRSQHSPRLSQP